ncbi:MAG: hypothetical protein GY804_11745 [Alphaproteobacteria bacterium]|nr:hypothetical protein [Alphaproteobacteria bacterium]
MTTYSIIENAKEEFGNYAVFWVVDQPCFRIKGRFGITEQWQLDQRYGIKPEGSFTLLAAK